MCKILIHTLSVYSSFDGYRRCLKMLFTLEDQCQEEPAAVIDEIIQRSAGILGEGACDEYIERCIGSGADIMRSTFAFITLIFLSVLTNHFFKVLWLCTLFVKMWLTEENVYIGMCLQFLMAENAYCFWLFWIYFVKITGGRMKQNMIL